MNDWVVWASLIAVAGALAVLVFLVVKVIRLMQQDEERHRGQ